MIKATLFKKLEDKSVRCLACSWYCRIIPNHVGVCGTRYNEDGILYSLVYGRPTGLTIDPVEKKPFYHLTPEGEFLSFGTIGCNFGCLFCQNAWASQSSKFKEQNNILRKIEKVITKLSIKITPQEIVDIALTKKVTGIAYTYNEPAIFAEFAYDTAKLAKKMGLKNVYVSNGFESIETFNLMKNFLDGINIDLKSFRDDFYRKICKAKIKPVLENIQRFFQAGIETEITTLIIPGYNDSAKELADIAKFIKGVSTDVPWHISAFRPEYQMLNVSPTPYETLIKAYNIGKRVGLKYIYLGNVNNSLRSSTYCPKCSTELIHRDNYLIRIKDMDLKTGRCKKCREKIYGEWN